MVMRKFKRSLDNTVEDSSDPNQLGVNSPGLARRNRGGSLSGELGGEVTNSPAGTRRRFVYKSFLSTQKKNFLREITHDLVCLHYGQLFVYFFQAVKNSL